VCSVPKSTHSTQQRTPTRGTDSVSRPLLAWSTRPIARFLRVFYTTSRFLRVFYTPGCPTNQYPFSSGRGGREQITCWCCALFVYTTARTTRMNKTPFCVMSLNQLNGHVTQSGGVMRLDRNLECGNSVCLSCLCRDRLVIRVGTRAASQQTRDSPVVLRG
jgi:hypothetical protein